MAALDAQQYDTTTDSVAAVMTDGTPAEDAFAEDGAVLPDIHQRIWDTGLGQFVYFTKKTIDATPAMGDTSPNHSGSLDATKHEVL